MLVSLAIKIPLRLRDAMTFDHSNHSAGTVAIAQTWICDSCNDSIVIADIKNTGWLEGL